MKSQPLAYNKDNQEDKEPLFDAVDTVKDCLRAFADMIPAIVANKESMRAAAAMGYATATDLADYLVKKGTPFRDAHDIVGRSVAYGIEHSKDLGEFTLAELQQFSSTIDEDVFDVLTLEGSVAARDHLGGTAPKQVAAAVTAARAALAKAS
jgi:argininosuccinate lyase